MSTVDSKAAFEQRLTDLELQDLLPKFTELKWLTFGDFGFASSAPPGGDAATFEAEVLKPLLGEQRVLAAKVRRLYAQSYALAIAETEHATTGDDKPVAMNAAEREARRALLSERLSGFSLAGANDPSNKLIDRMAAILLKSEVRYVEWSKCSERSQELVDIPDVTALKVGKDGLVHQAFIPHDPSADCSTDLLLDLCWRRRALAADVAGLCSYECMHNWHEVMKAEYLRAPPAGFGRVTLAQCKAADEEVWRLVAASCRTGVGKKPGAIRTRFEEAFNEATRDFGVRLRMQPLPRGSSSSASSSSFPPAPPGQPRPDRELQTLRNQLNQAREQNSNLKRKMSTTSGVNLVQDWKKGKGKGKGKKDNRPRQAPAELRGKQLTTSNGDNICYSFNLGGCPDAAPGERCPKGWHVCAEPGCGKAHPIRGNH